MIFNVAVACLVAFVGSCLVGMAVGKILEYRNRCRCQPGAPACAARAGQAARR